jgi:hypothetical protein
LYPINQLLLYRFLYHLQQQGVNTANQTPALLRDQFKVLDSGVGIDTATANSRLHLWAWNGVALDYQSMQLALTAK